MNVIETTAPISIDNLKQYFTDKTTVFVINYKDSTLKGAKLLTYLSNLDIPCDINFENCSSSDCFDMLKEYLNSSMIVNVASLERVIINILHQAKGLVPVTDKEFIEDNKEILNKWISKLESLTLYNMYIVKDDAFKEFVDSFPVDETKEMVGVNFISLLKHKSFYSLYRNTDQKQLKFYSHYFNEYVFKGKNLFSYWANENNPLFLLTYGIAEGLVKDNEYVEMKNKTIQELKNVSPVQ
jgi:hypothetical protein